MAQTLNILNAATVVGPGPAVAVPPDLFRRGFTIALVGSGSVSAEAAIQVSNDQGTTWCNRMTFSPAGTAGASAPVTAVDVDPISPFPLVRVNLTAVSGAAVSVSMTASGDGK